MRLYLVQHGQAKPKDLDPQRPLTEQGVGDVGNLAEFLKPLGVSVAAVWHSGKTRALQTAEILAPALPGPPQVHQRDGLAPNDPIDPVRDELAGADRDLMIVGHLPFLGKLAAALVVGDEEADVVTFQQGGGVCLERDESATWAVRWMVIPDLLRRAT